MAGLTDRQMNRVVDEHLVPESLFEQQGSHRRFTLLGAVFARFYFAHEDLLLAGARRGVLEELMARIERLQADSDALGWVWLDAVDWKIERKALVVDVWPCLQETLARAEEVAQASALVTTDPDIMGGAPVFAGTRVPVDMVLGSLTAGITMDRLKASYPFLTEAHIRAATIHHRIHPRRGRPRRVADLDPELRPRTVRILRRSDPA